MLCTNRGDKTAVYRIGKVFIIKVEGRSLYYQEIARILGRSEMGNKVTLKQIAQPVYIPCGIVHLGIQAIADIAAFDLGITGIKSGNKIGRAHV